MAYKDEYEVARLYTDGDFAEEAVASSSTATSSSSFHLAPPLLRAARSATGQLKKREYGALDDAARSACSRD